MNSDELKRKRRKRNMFLEIQKSENLELYMGKEVKSHDTKNKDLKRNKVKSKERVR
ncbi:MAG: hypothetical protein ACRCUS_02770 [Anaerovoracaceae bacterium]